MITDRFGRVHDYLRVSLTDACNMRCTYCMPEENYAFTPVARLMQVPEIEKLVGLFVNEGVKKVRLTGGEPLVRKDAGRIMEALSKMPVELTLTTNASRINEHLDALLASTIRTINISLDTLQPEKFTQLTRRNLFHRVRSNIELLLQHGFQLKINAVIMKGVNDEEVLDFIEWTRFNPVQIRFIEFMPFEGNQWDRNKVFTLDELLSLIASRYAFLPAEGALHDTAKPFLIPGHAGSFAVISTMTAPFCGDCNRMRLTADGKLKNCLFSNGETDLLSAFRRGEPVLPLIRASIFSKEKALGGQFATALEFLDATNLQNRSMIAIGG